MVATKSRSDLGAFVLHLDCVRATLEARVAAAHGSAITLAVDELAQISRDVQTAALVLRGYHAQMVQEGKAVVGA